MYDDWGKMMARGNGYFSLSVGFSGVVNASFYAMANHMVINAGLTLDAIGYFASVYAVGSLCSTLASGAVADRWGKPRVVKAALFVLAVGCFLLAHRLPLVFVYTGVFFLGAGAGCNETQSSAILAERNPQHATRWMNISQVLFCVGAIVAPVVAVWYSETGPGGYLGWFGLLAALAIGVLLLSFVVSNWSRPEEAENSHWSLNLFSVLSQPRYVLVCILSFLYVGCESVSVAYIKPYFSQRGMPEAAAAAAISLFWLCMIATRLAGAFLSGREWGSILFFALVAVVGFGLLVCARQVLFLYLGVALVGAGCGPVWPMLFVLGVRLHPNRSGAAFAVMSLLSAAGGALFPTLIGTLPGNLTVTFGLCGMLALLLWLGAFRAWYQRHKS